MVNVLQFRFPENGPTVIKQNLSPSDTEQVTPYRMETRRALKEAIIRDKKQATEFSGSLLKGTNVVVSVEPLIERYPLRVTV